LEYLVTEGLKVSRVALGTWAIGGFMWGGTDEKRSLDTIRTAVERGITVIDTAPAYGFGRSEEIVGKAISEMDREEIIISTKVGIEWIGQDLRRNSSKERILKEIDDSLKRLGTEYVDIYYVHWPDPLVDIRETASTMEDLYEEGKIRAIGVSNYSIEQMELFRTEASLHFCQPPYNIFERDIEDGVMDYCKTNDIGLMTYGALCRGLLSGKMTGDRDFKGDDLRNIDPKFKKPRFDQYLEAVEKLGELAEEKYDKGLLEFSLRWILDKGIEVPIWGAREPQQLEPVNNIWDFEIDPETMNEVDRIIDENVKDPSGPEFMAPPDRRKLKG
jgi:aryl-alcohol dehydrogenase-like predicted oxidoreductase